MCVPLREIVEATAILGLYKGKKVLSVSGGKVVESTGNTFMIYTPIVIFGYYTKHEHWNSEEL